MSLWVDEVFTAWGAAVGERLTRTQLLESVHGALHVLLVHLSTAAFGTSEWAIRLPSAIAAILAIPAMAALAARWLGRETAPWAAWLTAGSPFLVWYAQEARNYAVALLFIVLTIHGLLALRDRIDARRVLAFAAASACTALTHLGAFLFAPFFARLALAAGAARTARVRAVLAIAVLAVVAVSPWIPQFARTWDWRRLRPARETVAGETALRGSMTFHPAAVPFTLHAFAVGYTLGPSLRELRAESPVEAVRRHALELAGVALVWGALGLLGMGALARRRRLLDLAAWVVPPTLAVSYFAVQNFKVFHPRYLMGAYPAFLLAAAAALADARPRVRLALAGGVAALWAVSLAQLYFDPAVGKEDYRGAVARVRALVRPGERILATGSEPPIEWYAGGAVPVDEYWLGFAADTSRMQERARARFAAAPGTWVVASRTWDLDPDDRFARWLDREVAPQDRWESRGVRVWHVVPADSAVGTGTGNGVP